MKKHQKSDESTKSANEEADDNETTNREAFSAYIPKQQANDIFRSDNSKVISII
jgi:hypothetical protein